MPPAALWSAAVSTPLSFRATLTVRCIATPYQAPRNEIVDYTGPGGPLRPLDGTAAADIYRFALEHFAAVSAKSVTAPTVALKLSASQAQAGAGDYTYSGVALREIKDGEIAAATVDRVSFTAMSGETIALEFTEHIGKIFEQFAQ